MSFLGSVSSKAKLERQFDSPGAFKKAMQGDEVSLPDGSRWSKIRKSSNNKHLWQGEPSNAVLFECIEVTND